MCLCQCYNTGRLIYHIKVLLDIVNTGSYDDKSLILGPTTTQVGCLLINPNQVVPFNLLPLAGVLTKAPVLYQSRLATILFTAHKHIKHLNHITHTKAFLEKEYYLNLKINFNFKIIQSK